MRIDIRHLLSVALVSAMLALPASAAAMDDATEPFISACHVSPIVANLDRAAHFTT